MYSLFTWARGVLPVLLVGLLVVVAVGCDGLGGVEYGDDIRQIETALASKVYELDGYEIRFDGPVLDVVYVDEVPVSVTKFTYTILAKPSSGVHLALEDPECATFVAASGGATNDGNPNGDIEFNSASTSIWYAFTALDGTQAVSVGEVLASTKEQGNDLIDLGPVAGPCRGVVPLEGYVYLDRDSTNLGYDSAVDGGVAGVKVNATYELEAPMSALTDATGKFHFDVFVPWYEYGLNGELILPSSPNSVDYTISILDDANMWLIASSASLFDPVTVPIADETVSVSSNGGQDPAGDTRFWGFYLNVKRALELFNTGNADSDGLDRTFWKVQATGKGTIKYRPVIDSSILMDSLFTDGFLGAVDTGGHYDGMSLAGLQEAFKRADNNDEYYGLWTSVLVLGLNNAWNRGICSFSPNNVQTLVGNDPYPRCDGGVNHSATRMVLEQGIGELNDMGGPNKAPTGTTKSVVDCVNGEC